MGTLENQSKKRRKRENIQKAVLTTLKIAGFLSLAAVAPNSLQYLESFGLTPGKRQKEIVLRSRDTLLNNGFIKYKNGFLELTEKGQSKLRLLEMKEWKIDKPRKWDKKWRMLIFDIPETKKFLRNRIRFTLLSIGFFRLQDSVWVYPYPCEDLINLLKVDFRVGKDLLYVIVDFIENDKNLKKIFGLPIEK